MKGRIVLLLVLISSVSYAANADVWSCGGCTDSPWAGDLTCATYCIGGITCYYGLLGCMVNFTSYCGYDYRDTTYASCKDAGESSGSICYTSNQYDSCGSGGWTCGGGSPDYTYATCYEVGDISGDRCYTVSQTDCCTTLGWSCCDGNYVTPSNDVPTIPSAVSGTCYYARTCSAAGWTYLTDTSKATCYSAGQVSGDLCYTSSQTDCCTTSGWECCGGGTDTRITLPSFSGSTCYESINTAYGGGDGCDTSGWHYNTDTSKPVCILDGEENLASDVCYTASDSTSCTTTGWTTCSGGSSLDCDSYDIFTGLTYTESEVAALSCTTVCTGTGCCDVQTRTCGVSYECMQFRNTITNEDEAPLNEYCFYDGSYQWGAPPATETACTDGHDNDCDGFTDLNDPDCPCSTATTSGSCETSSAAKGGGCDWCTECSSIGSGTWTGDTGTNSYTPNQYYLSYGTGNCKDTGTCIDYTCAVGMCGSDCTVPSIEDFDLGVPGECDDQRIEDTYYCNDLGVNGLTDVYRTYWDFQCDVGFDCGCRNDTTKYERFDETRCVAVNCDALCDGDVGCDPTSCGEVGDSVEDGCRGYDGTSWKIGCQLGDTYCIYFDFSGVPNDCDLTSSCTCSSNTCETLVNGCDPFAGTCDSAYITADKSDMDNDGWSNQCEDLFLSIPNQSMQYLELYPFEKSAVKGYATFTPVTILSCDEPWVVDEGWNLSSSGNWRIGCETGPKMESEFLWGAPFAPGTPYTYEIFWDKGTNGRCDFSYGEYRHFDYLGCDQSSIHYWDEAQRAQDGLGDPDLDGSTFGILSPVFWYNDVEMDYTVSEGTGDHNGEFYLSGTVGTVGGAYDGNLEIKTNCSLSYGFEILEALKESPDSLDDDPYPNTAAVLGADTDWLENLDTDQRIQPWDHLYLIYIPSSRSVTFEIQVNDFLSDMYLDDVLVTSNKIEFCSEGDCYCEHFAENCARVNNEDTGRTVRLDLGTLSKGFHKLKFKVVDVWVKGFAKNIKIISGLDEAVSPTYTCTQTTVGTSFSCYLGAGLENHEFCMRPQNIGCISFVDDPDLGATPFENVLQTHQYADYRDCPTACTCEPESDYYLNTVTGYCESLCCAEWPCPGCCADRCVTPIYVQ